MDISKEYVEEISLIHKWLEDVLSCQLEDVPQFEENDDTVAILSTLRRLNIETDQNVTDIAQDFRLKTKEYKAESNRCQSVVLKVIRNDKISSRAHTFLDALVSTALQLQLSDPSDSMYILAICNLLKELQTIEKAKTEQTTSTASLGIKTKDVIQKSTYLQKILALTAKNVVKMEMEVNKLSSKNNNLSKKIQEYGKTIEKLQMLQQDRGVTSLIYHRAVSKCNEDLKQLSRKLSDLQEELDTYCCLPNNKELTKEKIEAARQELMELEIDLAQKIEKSLL